MLNHTSPAPGGDEKLTLVLFVRLLDLCLFGFVGFLVLLLSGFGLDYLSLAWPALVQLLVFIYPGIQ